MKLVTFSVRDEPSRVGLVDPEAGRVRDLYALAKATKGVDAANFAWMMALIESVKSVSHNRPNSRKS